MGLLEKWFGKDKKENKDFDGYVEVDAESEVTRDEPSPELLKKKAVLARLDRLEHELTDFAVAARRFPVVLSGGAALALAGKLEAMQKGTLKEVTDLLREQPENLETVLGWPLSRDNAGDWNVMNGTYVWINDRTKDFVFKFPEGAKASEMPVASVAEIGVRVCQALKSALNRDFLSSDIVNDLAREISGAMKSCMSNRI